MKRQPERTDAADQRVLELDDQAALADVSIRQRIIGKIDWPRGNALGYEGLDPVVGVALP